MTPKNDTIKDYRVSQELIGNIRNFLQIILCEIWVIKRQQDLTKPGQESLRVIGREVENISNLLPGDPK